MSNASSLEDLAVEAYERLRNMEEEEARRKKEAAEKRLNAAQQSFKETYVPDVREQFARQFGLDPRDELISTLKWETEPKEWTTQVQTAFEKGEGLQWNLWPHLYVTIGDVLLQIEAVDHFERGNLQVRYVDKGSSGPVNSLEDLGRRIIEQRQYQAKQEGC